MTKTWDSRIARALVLPLRDTAVHPNHLTTLGLVIGLGAASLYASGADRAADLGAFLLVATMIVDHADGELARMTGKTSAFGCSYDRLADLTVKLAIFLGMGVGLRDGPLDLWGPALGISAAVALVTIFNARSALARRRGEQEAFRQPAFAGFEIEDVLYLIAPITWLDALPEFVAAAGIGAPIFALWTLVQLGRVVVADRAAKRAQALAAPTVASPLATFFRPGLAVGIAILTVLVAYHGVAEVGKTLAVAGWGLLAVAAFHLIPLVGDALAWRRLLPDEWRPAWPTFVRARWIGESVNGLLPVMQIGGNVVKARLLARAGIAGPLAGASVVVDMTLMVLSQLLFSLVGIGILLTHYGGNRLALAAVVGVAFMGLLAMAFLVAQRSGMFGTGARAFERIIGTGAWRSLSAGAEDLDAQVVALYRRRRPLLVAGSWHLASWIIGSGEVWLALHLLGHPVSLSSAMLLESLGQALRAAAFAIPGALGVQEGGFLVLGGLLGLAPETCLALSLSKRAREFLLGVPGLVAWQMDPARWSLEMAHNRVERLERTST